MINLQKDHKIFFCLRRIISSIDWKATEFNCVNTDGVWDKQMD